MGSFSRHSSTQLSWPDLSKSLLFVISMCEGKEEEMQVLICMQVLCRCNACVNLRNLQALCRLSLCKYDPIAFYMIGFCIIKFVSLQVVEDAISF